MRLQFPRLSACSLLLLAPLVATCAGGEPEVDPGSDGAAAPSEDAADPAPEAPAEGAPAGDPAAKENANRFDPGGPIADADLGKYHVAMTCEIEGESVGTMTFDLWTDAAPITTRNFLRLVDTGFYDGITFHRILRTFMIQGGDPTGTGAGNSPYGTIKAEFSDAPERNHGYGVLSMARLSGRPDTASCQFFLCCDESPSVWSLDGQYTSFGRMTSGVEALEKLADVPTSMTPRGEKSKPNQTAKITKAVVVEGAAPTGETIARPMPPVELNGEPERIVVQHCLISFEGRGLREVTRTKEEAQALATKILGEAQGGASMDELVREHSDDQVQEGDETPGHYTILNRGVSKVASDRALFNLDRDIKARFAALQESMRDGTIDQPTFTTRVNELQAEAMASLDALLVSGRDELVPAFGDIGFKLEVGEIGLATYDETTSKYGWHIIKRVE